MSYPATTYPYAAYQHPQSNTATPYPYQNPTTPYSNTQAYPAWPYGYTYQHPQAHHPPPAPTPSASSQRPVPAAAYPAATTTTFASYPTTYSREPSSSKASRKQSNLKGLFAKEREFRDRSHNAHSWIDMK